MAAACLSRLGIMGLSGTGLIGLELRGYSLFTLRVVHQSALCQVSGKEAIPDGTGSRQGMFSARFDGKETERLFRQVYKILKDLNYSVLMVEEGVGGDFGDSTAIFLGRLRKRKGVMLSVCSWHYGEITNSKYSSYEEVKFAHGHGIDILPLRVCDDPWPPEPPSGPEHPYDKEGKAEGLLALAIPPSQIYVDCRGKDAHWIAARIAEKLYRKPAEAGHKMPAWACDIAFGTNDWCQDVSCKATLVCSQLLLSEEQLGISSLHALVP